MNRRHRYAFATAAAIWTCCAAQPAIAQLPDLVELSAQYMPGVPVEDPRPARAQVASYDASFNVPIALGQRTFLIPGLVYHAEAISFSQVPAEFIELREFHSLETSFLFVQLLPEGWSISLRLAPGVAGDFAAFDSGMLRLSTVAMATKALSERFVLGGGAIASYAFGTLLPLPMVYLDWTPTRYFLLETSIPAFLNAKFTVWDRVEIGARAEVAGNAYAVRDSRIRSAWPCAAGISTGSFANWSSIPVAQGQADRMRESRTA